jgi:hypothetical protein
MLLRQAAGEFPEGEGLAGQSSKGRAEGGADKSGGESLTGNVSNYHQNRSIGFGDHIEVISADLVAGSGTRRDGVTGDGWHGLRQKALLDGAGGVEILGQAGVVEVALMVDGILDGDCGLEDQTFEEVAFVKAKWPSFRGCNDEF